MSRVRKTHPRIEAYGDVDELNAHIGLTLAAGEADERTAGWLRRVQNDLFDVGAGLAVPPGADAERARRRGGGGEGARGGRTRSGGGCASAASTSPGWRRRATRSTRRSSR